MFNPNLRPDEIRREYTRKVGIILRQYDPTLFIPEIVYPTGLAFLVEQVLEVRQPADSTDTPPAVLT